MNAGNPEYPGWFGRLKICKIPARSQWPDDWYYPVLAQVFDTARHLLITLTKPKDDIGKDMVSAKEGYCITKGGKCLTP